MKSARNPERNEGLQMIGTEHTNIKTRKSQTIGKLKKNRNLICRTKKTTTNRVKKESHPAGRVEQGCL